MAVVRVGVDLKLFNLLCERDDSWSLEELAKRTGADPTLLGESHSTQMHTDAQYRGFKKS